MLLVEAKLLGLRLDDSWKTVRATQHNLFYLNTILARKRAQK